MKLIPGMKMRIILALVLICNCVQDVLAEPRFKDKNLQCLALNIHFESNIEPLIGKIAVAQVTLQRVQSPYYPNTVCGVVAAGIGKKGCAFSWLCDGKENIITINNKKAQDLWDENIKIAELMLSDRPPFIEELKGATLYHNHTVEPWWSKDESVVFLVKIFNHYYYKEKRV